MSKTIEEIRAIVATNRGYGSWEDFLEWEDSDDVAYHLAIEYSNQQTQELKDQNEELVEMLEDMETAWQSLPYGHNPVRDTQNWISNSIHPQILRMREWVSEHKTKHNHLKSNTNEN